MRAALVLFVGFAAIAEQLGLEAILGTFIAGAILSLVDRDQVMTHPDFRRKLEAIGFGFFIPVFFVTSGVRFDLDALTASASNLRDGPDLPRRAARRARPARLALPRPLDGRGRAIAGLLQATSLPFIVAATAIGLELGLIDAAGERGADRRRPAVGPALPARRPDLLRRDGAARAATPQPTPTARDVTPRPADD